MRLCLPLCCVATLACTGADGPLLSRVPGDAAPPDPVSDAAGPSSASDAASPAPTSDSSLPVLEPHLVHHYSFSGTGTIAYDSAGDADGEIVGASLSGAGDLLLTGGLSGPHVTLPPGIISSLESVTIEAWLTWAGGGGYQRVFDFGNSDAGAGKQGSGTRHFSLALDGNGVRLLFDADPTTGSDGWRGVFSTPALSMTSEHQVTAVFDRGESEIRLYVDGLRRGFAAVPASESLSNIDDVNNWLGMAQWAIDSNFAGTLSDFRIYDVPLSDTEIMVRFESRY